MHALDPALSPTDVVAGLDPAICQLIATCDVLYAGDWDDLAEDLRRRQAGKPYLFRLTNEPPDALAWAGRLQAYEQARGERLAPAVLEEDDH